MQDNELYRRVHAGVVAMTLLFLTLGILLAQPEAKDIKTFTLINVILDDAKIWLPSTLIVHAGDDVELTLVNKLDAPHGFKIAALDVETVVPPNAKATVHFTAQKAGLYPFICHLHPPHIGGQLLIIQ